MIKEISKSQFEQTFPKINTYGLSDYSPIYLENGVILIETEWNGESYFSNGKKYLPIYNKINEDDFEIVGFEIC